MTNRDQKIAIVGDLHIAPTPQGRIDDYFQTGLDKITELTQYCKRIIFLGDIFTSAHVNEEYVYRLLEHLKYLQCLRSVEFYTIIGNHDVTNEDEANLKNSSLGLMAISGIMQIITPDKPLRLHNLGDGVFYTFNTIPVNFKRAKEYLQNKQYENGPNCVNILLAHHEYETGSCCFTYEDFKDLGCKMIFLGHDHKPMDGGRKIYPEYTIYRSGSIMRNRGDDYNFTRTLYYYILECGNVSCQAITTKPAQDVFKFETLTRQNYHKEQFIESINSVIDKYKRNISTQNRFSIKNILEELQTRKPIIDFIEKKYQIQGERFE